MRSQILLPALLFVVVPGIASGLEANLAKADSGTTTVQVQPNDPLQVTIVNLAPRNDYSTSLLIRTIPLKELEIEAIQTRRLAAPCPQLSSLDDATDEKRVPTLIGALEKGVAQGDCDATQAAEVIRKTRRLFAGPFTLQAGQELVLTVERQAQDSPKVEKAVWTFVWTTGPRGEWRASYGFGFFEEDDAEFFTRPGDEEGTFVIQQESERGDLVVAPAVFFTWARESKKLGPLDHGFAGGLGFDLSKPVVFAGYQLTYNQNYTLNFGLVARPEKELDGRYEAGQVLKEDLEEDQLHDDDSYGVAGFVGLSFRFSANPFQKSGGENE